jgi:uncharacterized protein YoxC
MTQKDGFLDGLKHMVFEDEPEKTNSAAGASAAAPAKAPATFAQPKLTPSTVAEDDDVYRRILARTDFDATEAGATVQKFLAPLASLPMDTALKFKTAVAQASAQTGLTAEKVLGTFDQLEAALDQERDAFTRKAQQFAEREVNGRSQRINEITAQIGKLQQELSTLSTELVQAQTKAAHAEGQFTAAVERRRSEIEQQKAQYAALLK